MAAGEGRKRQTLSAGRGGEPRRGPSAPERGPGPSAPPPAPLSPPTPTSPGPGRGRPQLDRERRDEAEIGLKSTKKPSASGKRAGQGRAGGRTDGQGARRSPGEFHPV